MCAQPALWPHPSLAALDFPLTMEGRQHMAPAGVGYLLCASGGCARSSTARTPSVSGRQDHPSTTCRATNRVIAGRQVAGRRIECASKTISPGDQAGSGSPRRKHHAARAVLLRRAGGRTGVSAGGVSWHPPQQRVNLAGASSVRQDGAAQGIGRINQRRRTDRPGHSGRRESGSRDLVFEHPGRRSHPPPAHRARHASWASPQ